MTKAADKNVGYLYVASVGDAMKIGRSVRPATRMQEHAIDYHDDVVAHRLFKTSRNAVHSVEQRALSLLDGTPRKSRERFYIDADTAADAIIAAARDLSVSLEIIDPCPDLRARRPDGERVLSKTIRLDREIHSRWGTVVEKDGRHASLIMREALEIYLCLQNGLTNEDLDRLETLASAQKKSVGKTILGMILTCLEQSPSAP